MNDMVLQREQLAQILGVSLRTIAKWTKQGKLGTPRRDGWRYLYSANEVRHGIVSHALKVSPTALSALQLEVVR